MHETGFPVQRVPGIGSLGRVDLALGTVPIEVDVVKLVGAGHLPGDPERVLQQLRGVEKLERRALSESYGERLTIGKLLERPQLFVRREILWIERSLTRGEPLRELALDRDVMVSFQLEQHIDVRGRP